MSKNIQVMISKDGEYQINMRGKSFTVLLDNEAKTYEIKGEIPRDVREAPEDFIEWLLPKLLNKVKVGKYKSVH
ncbi:hypothetical protein [Endozoicomonas atrinae]|uniref:hypothetical protein n=1 Tax=Endozoicomonas atrinae TaxID=1333660 RepID=UPI0008263593|nr:hypothetical protein [Endozoicomonas atrinae]